MPRQDFASYCNRYAGHTGWVVGRGPTDFDYHELARAAGPAFFVNDAVALEERLAPGVPSFFFAHDGAMACWLARPGLRSIPVVITDQPETGPATRRRRGLVHGPDDPLLRKHPQAVRYTRNGRFSPDSLPQRSREEIGAAAQLYCREGTIVPLLHFAWYLGCARLVLVGCDGLPEAGYDPRLENRSATVQQNAFGIRVTQEALLRQLGQASDYAGTPPHHLSMIAEARVLTAVHAEFLRGLEALRIVARRCECLSFEIRDCVSDAGRCWVNLEWPSVATCADFHLSSDFHAWRRDCCAPLLGDVAANLTLAYHTVLGRRETGDGRRETGDGRRETGGSRRWISGPVDRSTGGLEYPRDG